MSIMGHGIVNVLYGLVSTPKNSGTFGYLFTIGFLHTVIHYIPKSAHFECAY